MPTATALPLRSVMTSVNSLLVLSAQQQCALPSSGYFWMNNKPLLGNNLFTKFSPWDSDGIVPTSQLQGWTWSKLVSANSNSMTSEGTETLFFWSRWTGRRWAGMLRLTEGEPPWNWCQHRKTKLRVMEAWWLFQHLDPNHLPLDPSVTWPINFPFAKACVNWVPDWYKHLSHRMTNTVYPALCLTKKGEFLWGLAKTGSNYLCGSLA